MTGRSGCRDLNSRISSFTAGREAATVEQRTMSAAALSRASTVCSFSVPPAEKSWRSLKIGPMELGIGPCSVGRPTRSLSMRKRSRPAWIRFAQAVSACEYDMNARYFNGCAAARGGCGPVPLRTTEATKASSAARRSPKDESFGTSGCDIATCPNPLKPPRQPYSHLHTRVAVTPGIRAVQRILRPHGCIPDTTCPRCKLSRDQIAKLAS